MKYCPLCRAEYRDQAVVCANCRAMLVSSMHVESALQNPPRLLWSGRNLQELDAIQFALVGAEIPANVQRALGGLIGSITRRASTIHVLSSNFESALQVAAQAITGIVEEPSETHICYRCGSVCSRRLAACPSCKATLISVSEPVHGLPGISVDAAGLRYCPLCGAEYLPAHTHCSICGVELVPGELRGKPLDEKERNEPIEVAWRGGDPIAVGNVVAILREAGIRHHVQASSDHLVFELAMPRPKYLVRVFRSDLPKVQEILAGIQDAPFFGVQVSADFPTTATEQANPLRTPWNPAAANAEVWAGDDSALAQLLEDCFFESRIPYKREGMSPGTIRYSVLPSDEPAAREIVREVREGTPPQ